MNTKSDKAGLQSLTIIKWLTYLMFMMFAMTTDAVGVIIPEVMKEFNLKGLLPTEWVNFSTKA
jgi:fucose permease